MLRVEREGVAWLEYELLADCKRLDHRVFLRHGGCSAGAYESLNFGTTKGDSIANVQANIGKVCRLMGCPTPVGADQQHGAVVAYVDSPRQGAGLVCDGLTTASSQLPLLIRHADCQSACFYDPVRHAVAAVHCGWRGNVQNIYGEAVAAMRRLYGSHAADLLVCVSPSLGPERAEFINYEIEFPESFWQFQYKPFYFDLWALAERQLEDAGVLPHHIQIARISTWENPSDYFSYRRAPVTGMHGSMTVLK